MGFNLKWFRVYEMLKNLKTYEAQFKPRCLNFLWHENHQINVYWKTSICLLESGAVFHQVSWAWSRFSTGVLTEQFISVWLSWSWISGLPILCKNRENYMQWTGAIDFYSREYCRLQVWEIKSERFLKILKNNLPTC